MNWRAMLNVKRAPSDDGAPDNAEDRAVVRLAAIARRTGGGALLPEPEAVPEPELVSEPEAEPEPPAPAAAITFDELRARHARPALMLYRPYPPTDLPARRSQIGGVPSLPDHMAWPRASGEGGCLPEGAPLHFLAQIDLAEQVWLPEGCPAQGTLFFFGALPDGYWWDSPSDTRVLYDPESNGEPRMPPEDLSPIQGGHNDYQRDFGEDDWLRCRTFPHWPLLGARIETMPDGDAFTANSRHAPEYAGYAEALEDFRAEQAAAALGIDLAALAAPDAPAHGALTEAPGFPWTPRFAALWGRAARARCPEDKRALLHRLIEWADELPAGSAIDAEAAEGVCEIIADWPAEVAPDMDRVLRRLVREAGGNPALAALLPDSIYARVADEHRVIAAGTRGTRRDGARGWTVRHHQIGGHVPSSQAPMPVDYARACLLQLQSDWGSEMMLCDMGEADFWIAPEGLAGADFGDVVGETRGG